MATSFRMQVNFMKKILILFLAGLNTVQRLHGEKTVKIGDTISVNYTDVSRMERFSIQT